MKWGLFFGLSINIVMTNGLDFQPLDHIFLTKSELEQILNHAMPTRLSTISLDNLIKDAFWHWSFPTIGLLQNEPPPYPYLPHFFTLKELAPKQGAGITIVLLDTGIAAFSLPEFEYYQHPNISYTGNFAEYNHCIIDQRGHLSRFEDLMLTIEPYLRRRTLKRAESALIKALKMFKISHDTRSIQQFVLTYGNTAVIRKYGLTTKGKKLIQKITDFAHHCTLCTVKNQIVIKELLPLVSHPIHVSMRMVGHGTHNYGIVTALAPRATILVLKTFDENGASTKSILIAALKKAQRLTPDILNLSLKFADSLDMTEPSSQELEKFLASFPYVVAAAGNSGNIHCAEGYPARLSCVPFDVGAFYYHAGECTIPSFSQYEPNVGPLFVLPGVNILSTDLIAGHIAQATYAFRSGTSAATAIMSGFLALLIGEFKGEFTREEILKVCYASTLKMHTTAAWCTKVVLGVLDMRTALFMLHVVRSLKNVHKKFDASFDHLVCALRYILLAQPTDYSQYYLHNVNFVTNFADYYATALKTKPDLSGFFIPDGLTDALQFVTRIASAALGDKAALKYLSSYAHNLVPQVAAILQNKNLTIDCLLPSAVCKGGIEMR
jgi:subtilisin family serine protease